MANLRGGLLGLATGGASKPFSTAMKAEAAAKQIKKNVGATFGDADGGMKAEVKGRYNVGGLPDPEPRNDNHSGNDKVVKN